MEYEHPLYTPPRSPRSAGCRDRHRPARLRRRLPRLGLPRGRRPLRARGGRAARPRVARRPLAALPTGADPQPTTSRPAVVYGPRSAHPRRRSARTFTHRSHTWLVDLDDLPDHGVLAGSRRATTSATRTDHPRERRRVPGRHGIDLDGGRVLMAAHPAAFGYCFNPISVFWCHDDRATGGHDRRGAQHLRRPARLPRPPGRARPRPSRKAMYVSPFHGTDGTTSSPSRPAGRPARGDRITLHTDDGAVHRLADRHEHGHPAAAAALRGTPGRPPRGPPDPNAGHRALAAPLPVQPRPPPPRKE
jgi:hypothetical protein